MKAKKRFSIMLIVLAVFAVGIIVYVQEHKKIELTDLSAYIADSSLIYMLAGHELIIRDEPLIFSSIKEGRFQDAISELEIIRKEKDNYLEKAVYENALAVTYSLTGEYEKALDLFHNIEKMVEDNTYNLDKAILNNMGIVSTYMSNINAGFTREIAVECFERALEYSGEVTDYENLIIRSNKTNAQQVFLSDGHEAVKMIEREIFIIIEKEKELLGSYQLITLMSYANLGRIYSAKGEYLKAEKLFKKALRLEKKLKGDDYILRIAEAGVYEQMGAMYIHNGESEKAIEATEKAILLYQGGTGVPSIFLSVCYSNLGVASRRLGESEKGMEFLIKALRHGPLPYKRSLIYRNISTNYYLRNDLEKGIIYRLKAYKVLEDGGFDHAVFYEIRDELELMYNQSTDIDKSEGFDIWLENQMEELEDEQL